MIWGQVFPINKYLWSSSYVLYTSGWAMIILSICVYMIDARGYRSWSKPFYVLGLNPLFIYVLSIVWVKILLYYVKITKSDGSLISGYQWIFSEWCLPAAGCYCGSLLFAAANVGLFWMIALALYRRKIFVSLWEACKPLPSWRSLFLRRSTVCSPVWVLPCETVADGDVKRRFFYWHTKSFFL